MNKMIDLLTREMEAAFAAAGYDAALGRVTLSNRPDLCEYQCNGAMAGAKQYKKAPIMIANDVAACLKDSKVFQEVNAVAPGFIATDMTDKLPEAVREAACESIPMKRMGRPEEIAALCSFLASDEASYISGAVISVDGGLNM